MTDRSNDVSLEKMDSKHATTKATATAAVRSRSRSPITRRAGETQDTKEDRNGARRTASRSRSPRLRVGGENQNGTVAFCVLGDRYPRWRPALLSDGPFVGVHAVDSAASVSVANAAAAAVADAVVESAAAADASSPVVTAAAAVASSSDAKMPSSPTPGAKTAGTCCVSIVVQDAKGKSMTISGTSTQVVVFNATCTFAQTSKTVYGASQTQTETRWVVRDSDGVLWMPGGWWTVLTGHKVSSFASAQMNIRHKRNLDKNAFRDFLIVVSDSKARRVHGYLPVHRLYNASEFNPDMRAVLGDMLRVTGSVYCKGGCWAAAAAATSASASK